MPAIHPCALQLTKLLLNGCNLGPIPLSFDHLSSLRQLRWLEVRLLLALPAAALPAQLEVLAAGLLASAPCPCASLNC